MRFVIEYGKAMGINIVSLETHVFPNKCKFCNRQEDKYGLIKQIVTPSETVKLDNHLSRNGLVLDQKTPNGKWQ